MNTVELDAYDLSDIDPLDRHYGVVCNCYSLDRIFG